MIIYDPRGMDWPQYCKLVTELFATNHLGYVNEEDWQHWATTMIGLPRFSKYSLPDPSSFSSWRDWAERLCGIISLETQ